MRRVIWSVVFLFVALSIPMAALGQDTASLSGTVTDESKAVFPGAIVSATEVGSGRPYQTVTDERGEYRISNVA